MRFFETDTVERIGYDFYCDVACRIVEARNTKEWTQAQLAKVSGISEARIARLEAVQARIYLDDVKKLAEALNASEDWLLEAEIDSQVGECLYLVSVERFPNFQLYQKSTSKRMAFLQAHERVSKECRWMGPRDRAIVKLVGVPTTDQELKATFPGKISVENDTILQDEK